MDDWGDLANRLKLKANASSTALQNLGASAGPADLYAGAGSAEPKEATATPADAKEEDLEDLVDKEKDKGELQLSEEAQRARARGIPTMPPLAD